MSVIHRNYCPVVSPPRASNPKPTRASCAARSRCLPAKSRLSTRLPMERSDAERGWWECGCDREIRSRLEKAAQASVSTPVYGWCGC